MTCQGCVASVTKNLSKHKDISRVEVDLKKETVTISSTISLSIEELQKALPQKFTLSTKKTKKESKWRQLRPLFLIFLYLIVGSTLVHYKEWNLTSAMMTFMGLFYIVFSFFKVLDIQGFENSFRMYDPLAKRFAFYGKIYPFIEVCLGVMFLLRWNTQKASILTLVVLGITTIGVVKTLISKKQIKCACLGSVLNLPMTEATLIENAVMIAMAGGMLVG